MLLIRSKSTDTEGGVAHSFEILFKHNGLRESVIQDGELKLRSELWAKLMRTSRVQLRP